ncbi:MAG: addiction module protein [Phycisphaeraceae bacterium]
MSNPVSIEGLTVAQKLHLMEAIWDDLCRSADDLSSPDWHAKVLAQRQARIDSKEATFSDWDEAKKRIRDATS